MGVTLSIGISASSSQPTLAKATPVNTAAAVTPDTKSVLNFMVNVLNDVTRIIFPLSLIRRRHCHIGCQINCHASIKD